MKKFFHGALLLSLLALALYNAVNSHSQVHEACKKEWSLMGSTEVQNGLTQANP